MFHPLCAMYEPLTPACRQAGRPYQYPFFRKYPPKIENLAFYRREKALKRGLLRISPDNADANEAVAQDQEKRREVTGPVSTGRIGKG